MDLVRGEVHGAPERVLHTRIEPVAAKLAQIFIQAIGVAAAKFTDGPDAEFDETGFDARADARNGPEVSIRIGPSRHFSLHFGWKPNVPRTSSPDNGDGEPGQSSSSCRSNTTWVLVRTNPRSS